MISKTEVGTNKGKSMALTVRIRKSIQKKEMSM